MAYKKKAESKEEKPKNAKAEKLKTIRERTKVAEEADHDNRIAGMADLKFVHVPGEQWERSTKEARGNRPCYEFNKTRISIKRVVNDMRANRPSMKVRGVEEGDKDTAEVYEGLIRNIWNVSDGDTVIDHAAEYQVGAGMGAWRVNVEYADNSFDQDIKIEQIRNPFCLYADPACQDPLKRDARYWILMTRISKTAFEARWPKAAQVDFEADIQFDDEDDWENEESVRIVEYWYKEQVDKTIYLLSDGKTVEAVPEGAQVVKERKLKADVIKMCIASGKSILEEADWAGSQFPFILVYGENVVIDGKQHWFGLTRFAKDPARAYNAAQTAAIETVALAPQAKYWATPDQALGHMEKWNIAHRENLPVMIYNNDPLAAGPPQRMQGADVPVALIQLGQIASDDIKSCTGIFDASLGKQGNETSGIAIQRREQQGEIATFNYMDNLSKGVRRTGEIIIDLIPKIIDTPRAIRILGVDGAEKYVKVNSPDPNTGQIVNDLSRGKYDLTVTSGPSFTTQRQEAAEFYTGLVSKDPTMMPLIGDLMFKSMDYPYAEQMAQRYKLMLPPQIQQAESEGKELPPEALQAMQQADQAMQMVQEQSAMIQEKAAKMQGAESALTKQIADLKIREATMKADYETLSAQLTNQESQLIKKEAAFILKQAQAGETEAGKAVEGDREALSTQVGQAVVDLQKQAQDFQAQAMGILAQIQGQAQPQVFMANPPKKRIGRIKRMNGESIVEIDEVA